jgi:hypothetical protein
MTPEERQLITGLFDRMRSYGAPEKDREAETLIGDAVRTTRDAPYMLVQSVLVQEHALQEAANRIKELEEQVRDLQGAGQSRATGPTSFLGGLLGGGRSVSQPGPGSVPAVGSRAPSTYTQDQQGPWPQTPPQQGAPAPSGGFLRSAMSTAAGVAGGVLAAGAIRDLFGGGAHAHANPPPTPAATAEQAKQDQDQDARQDASDAEQAQQDQEQDALQDASDDDSSWDDGGGDDLDV